MSSSETTKSDDWEWDETWGEELQAAVDDLDTQMWNHIHEDEDWETPSGYPFCGCDVCRTRELLCVVVPIVLDGYIAGRIRRHGESITKENDNA